MRLCIKIFIGQSFLLLVTDDTLGVSRTIIKSGTTMGPDFERDVGKFAPRCPSSHKYSFADGEFCCKTNVDCNGSTLSWETAQDCCPYNDYLKCSSPDRKCGDGPIDAEWSNWYSWSVCEYDLGYCLIKKHRERKCLTRPKFGGLSCNVEDKHESSSCAPGSAISTCPQSHPYAYLNGDWCCAYPRTYDAYPMDYSSDSCFADGHRPCPCAPCEFHCTVTGSYVESACPTDYPYPYNGGEWCCATTQTKVPDVPLAYDSYQGCLGDNNMPCACPPCLNTY